MNYVVYYKDTLEVYRFVNSENVKLTNDLAIARCENIPQGDKFKVVNLQSKTEKYTVKKPKEVIKTDEQGNEYTETEYIEVEKEREYQTCELVGEVDNKRHILIQINALKSWFNTNYRMYNEMLTRREALNIEKACVDNTRNKTYYTLNDLYVEAEKVVEEINALENQL